MQHLWNKDTLASFAAGFPDGVPPAFIEQVYATRLIGSNADLALHGGGNTSYKGTANDFLGDPTDALFVKASGSDMSAVTADDFVVLDLERLRRLDREIDCDDDVMAEFFASAKIHPSAKQPSIETLLHALLPFRFVSHSHPSAILALTNRTDAERCIRQAFAGTVPVIPYTEVGVALARSVAKTVAAAPGFPGIIIAHHGLVTWGDCAREAYDRTIALVSEAETWLNTNRTRPVSLPQPSTAVEQAKNRYLKVAPLIRGCLTAPAGDDEQRRAPFSLVLLTDETVLSILETPELQPLIVTPPLTPDYIIRTGRLPLCIRQPESDDAAPFTDQLTKALNEYRESDITFRKRNTVHAGTAPENVVNHLPRVVLIPGIGAVCCGITLTDARIAADITRQNLLVKKTIFETGGTLYDLDDRHCFNMEFRSYQRAKLGSSGSRPSSTGRVVLVTGSAGAIGSGLCHHLLQQGYQIAASDLPGEPLDRLIDELSSIYGNNSVAPVPMDVTGEQSVHDGFHTIINTFGGLDAVVVNAGIAYVATIADMDFTAFQRLERVNAEGTLLTVREAARLFKLQNSGGDIVLISTKNVFAPGASFGAYSATKAAAHQIARIASLEFAAMDVRVNMVAPDAVFSHGAHKSGLWATVGPGRMKSRGLDEAGLEEYYRNRNLLKAKVTASHVAAAVEFFLERRTPTSGATIPVDGGLPDATPR